MRFPRRSPRVAVWLLSVAYAGALFHRAAFSAFSTPIGPEMHLSLADLSVVSSAFFWSYLLLLLPLGLLSDVAGPSKSAALACVASGAGCALFALADGPWALAGARVVIAAGCALAFISLIGFCSLNFPSTSGAESGRGLFLGNLGGILAGAPLAYAMSSMDWRSLSFALAGLSFGWAFLIHKVAPVDDAGKNWRAHLAKALPDLRSVFASPIVYLGVIWLASLAGAFYSFTGFGLRVYLESVGVSATGQGALISAIVATFASGAYLWGSLGDNRALRPVILISAHIALCMAWAELAFYRPSSMGALAFVFAVAGASGGAFSLVYKMVAERFPKSQSGAVTAVVNCGMPLGAAFCQTAGARLDGVWVSLPCLALAALGLAAAIAHRARNPSALAPAQESDDGIPPLDPIDELAKGEQSREAA